MKSRPPKSGGWSEAAWALEGRHDDSDTRESPKPARVRATRWAGSQAYRRRLWVLDLHPQRHRHVLGAVRRLCGPGRQRRRRADRRRSLQPAQCLPHDDMSARLELHSWARRAVRRAAQSRALLDLRRPHVSARGGLSLPRDLGIRRHDKQGRWPLAERLSVLLLHFGRHARRPRDRRPDLAHLCVGSGRRQGPAAYRAAAPLVLQPVLARARYRLDRGDDAGLPDGSPVMDGNGHLLEDRAPGVEEHSTATVGSYTAGLGLAILATIASFIVAQTNLLWPPGIPVGLIVLALAQIGIHLVFFLHLGTGRDNTNNILALAFGVLIVFLVIGGSIWIIANLNASMTVMPTN